MNNLFQHVDNLLIVLADIGPGEPKIQKAMWPLIHHSQMMFDLQLTQTSSELDIVVNERICNGS